MNSKAFIREKKDKLPVLAICYDFDKTLSPDDMQAQGYIQSVNLNTKDFWSQSNQLAEENDMDQNLAYMYKMIKEAEGNLVFNRKNLMDYGANVALFPGVADWFERICNYGKDKEVIVEHYVISSGLKEMIEGTIVAQKGWFKKIYASSFYYNDRGVAVWPSQVVNYTNKTQFLFRIEKGVLDVNDQGVNEYFPPEDIRVPFRNMVYIGDSDTDIPCMKLVNTYGGHSIGVFNPDTNDKKKVYKMLNDNRIKYFAPANYTENSELDLLVKSIIDRTAANEKLESIYFKLKDEVKDESTKNPKSEDEKKKESLILALENSGNFANTHTIISEMVKYESWTEEQAASLFDIAVSNTQVNWILTDCDVAEFYNNLISSHGLIDQDAEKVQNELSSNEQE